MEEVEVEVESVEIDTVTTRIHERPNKTETKVEVEIDWDLGCSQVTLGMVHRWIQREWAWRHRPLVSSAESTWLHQVIFT